MAEQWEAQAVRESIGAGSIRGEAMSIEDVAGEKRLDVKTVKEVMQDLRDRGEIVQDGDTDRFTLAAGIAAMDDEVVDGDIDDPDPPLAAPEGFDATVFPYQEIRVAAPEPFTMPRAMLGALDDESLGAMIRAGVEGAGGGPFEMRIA